MGQKVSPIGLRLKVNKTWDSQWFGDKKDIAKNIVEYRETYGKFKSRRELLKVAKLGEKAYTQCAGFLRIPGGDNILDNTAVHPESYEGA